MSDGRPRTPLRDLPGCEAPILQAGMGGVARAELAAEVAEVGASGCSAWYASRPN